jgi:hypothetical protein
MWVKCIRPSVFYQGCVFEFRSRAGAIKTEGGPADSLLEKMGAAGDTLLLPGQSSKILRDPRVMKKDLR